MAKMYPSSKSRIIKMRRRAGLEADPSKDKGFRGEMLVYDRLAKLPSDWMVIYSYAFLDRIERTKDVNREADFVILIPGKGLMVLEVKNRRFTISGGKLIDAEGKQCDPLLQARKAAENIVEFLKCRGKCRGKIATENSNPTLPRIEYRGLAILLGVRSPDQPLSPGGYVFDNDLHDIEAKITETFIFNLPFASSLCEEIWNCLLESRRLTTSYDSMVDVFEEKTALVSGMLSALRDCTGGIWVEGCAGSGKTVMAISEIVRLCKTENPPRILYTCYTKRLVDYVDRQIRDQLSRLGVRRSSVKVCSFFSIVRELINRDPRFTMNCLVDEDVDAALDELKHREDLRFDYIFVDEAQDNASDMQRWHIVRAMGRSTNENDPTRLYHHIYAFADSNQNLFGQTGRDALPKIPTFVRLSANLRNPGNIAEFAAKGFDHTLGLSYLNDLEGRLVLREGSDDAEERADIVNGIVQEIYEEFDAKEKDVVILSPLAEKYTGNREDPAPRERTLRILKEIYNYKDEQLSTIKAFKGLEAPFIILVDVPGRKKDEWGFKSDDFYVACTRAKVGLYIVPTCSGYVDLKELILG